MDSLPTKQELEKRIENLSTSISKANPNWDTALIISKINQYYLCSTMQDGIFVLKKDGSYAFFVRRSFERALIESPLKNIYQMESYKDIVEKIGFMCGITYIETEIVTIGILERLKKYLNLDEIKSLDRIFAGVRAIKSEYEISIIKESGRQHNHLFLNIIPTLLKEGISEVDFTAELFEKMLKLGYQGVSRFSMFQNETVIGQVAFGENSLFPTNFDGPGGMLGMCPSVPSVGSRERVLKKGDLVFLDIGYGVNGYHTDKTQVYMFGKQVPYDIAKIQRECIKIQTKTASLLKPQNIPSDIYNNIMSELSQEFLENFMGFGNRKVKFLGHGVGLFIDELPVIANGFKEPLVENMVIAIEPKKGIANVGMVGVEDTYLVTADGGKCLTGGGIDIIEI